MSGTTLMETEPPFGHFGIGIRSITTASATMIAHSTSVRMRPVEVLEFAAMEKYHPFVVKMKSEQTAEMSLKQKIPRRTIDTGNGCAKTAALQAPYAGITRIR